MTRSFRDRPVAKPAAAFLALAVTIGLGATAFAEDAASPGEAAAKSSDCFSCHAVNSKVVGPAFVDVAKKFDGQSGAQTELVNAIKNGHVGTWGNVPMPAHPQLSDQQLKDIVTWVLSLKPQQQSSAASPAQTYSYTVNGQTVKTDFPIFQQGTKKVTPAVFRGYEMFNSYCFRCHGEDALGGSYAPNLRASLSNGMDEQGFTSVAMTGRKDKGMPAWAGFFTPDDIRAIYEYTKARSVGAIGTGTPAQ